MDGLLTDFIIAVAALVTAIAGLLTALTAHARITRNANGNGLPTGKELE